MILCSAGRVVEGPYPPIAMLGLADLRRQEPEAAAPVAEEMRMLQVISVDK
jgi:hypothetical protein